MHDVLAGATRDRLGHVVRRRSQGAERGVGDGVVVQPAPDTADPLGVHQPPKGHVERAPARGETKQIAGHEDHPGPPPLEAPKYGGRERTVLGCGDHDVRNYGTYFGVMPPPG